MVPDRDAFDDYYPSQQELIKMAVGAVGKPTRPHVYPRDRARAAAAAARRDKEDKESI